MSKTKNEAKINIASNEPNADGQCKLNLSFNYNGLRLRMYTRQNCLPECFDKNRHRVNRKHPLQFETNKILDNLCSNVVA